MRTGIVVLWLLLLPVAVCAQDFASLLIAECKADTNLHCVTIGPKMMAEIVAESGQDDGVMQELVKDLRSMQLVTAQQHTDYFFDMATAVADRWEVRFEEIASVSAEGEKHRILVRRKGDRLVELVMYARRPEQFMAINFTGDMSPEFIPRLMRMIRMGETRDL